MSLSSGTLLRFDGGTVALFGWLLLGDFLAALILPTRGLILLAYPLLCLWWFRWWIGHVHSNRRRLRFVGSLAQVWWRTLGAMAFSIPIITIPIVLVRFTRWVASNVWIESEKIG